MTIIITDELAHELLAKAVAIKGSDYVYTYPEFNYADGDDYEDWRESDECRYVDARNNVPSCIVGYGLVEAGVPIAALHRMDLQLCTPLQEFFVEVLKEYDVEVEPKARLTLAAGQKSQDMGHNWGQALREADDPDVQRTVLRASQWGSDDPEIAKLGLGL